MPGLKKTDTYLRVRASLLCLAGFGVVATPTSAWRGVLERKRLRRLSESLRSSCQVIDTDGEGYVHWDTPAGKLWTPPGAGPNWASLLTAESLLDVYRVGTLSFADSTVIDGGANIGIFSRQALARGAQRVVAFEPSSANREALRRNLQAAYDRGALVIRPEGLSSTQGQAFLETVDPENPGANRVSGEPTAGRIGEWVSLTTLDEVAASLALQGVSFVKMDIEGAELGAIDGAAQVLKSQRPRLAVAVEHTSDPANNASEVARKLSETYHYQVEGGYMRVNRNRRVYPEILYAT